MNAMVLNKLRDPLEWKELPDRFPGRGEIRVKVSACGVCRTDLHVLDGELPNPQVPIIPGHEIVGRIDVIGEGVVGLTVGQRVGIPWLGHTCGVCPYCVENRENLCDRPVFTGYTRDGGFATAAIADARFAFPLARLTATWRSPRCSAQVSSDGAHSQSPARAGDWGSMASAPQPISWRKSPVGRGDPSSPSRVRQMLRRKPLLAARLLRGPEGPTRCRRSRSTRRSSLQTGATSCRWRSRRSARAVVLYARAST